LTAWAQALVSYGLDPRGADIETSLHNYQSLRRH